MDLTCNNLVGGRKCVAFSRKAGERLLSQKDFEEFKDESTGWTQAIFIAVPVFSCLRCCKDPGYGPLMPMTLISSLPAVLSPQASGQPPW